MTATEAAIAAAGSGAPAAEAAPAADTRDMLRPNAPKHYTVKRGDTLWGIASMYLKDPWLWPEVWVINPQVPNPHLIYPGDKLALAYGAERPPRRCGSRRPVPCASTRACAATALESAIPTIPYSSIAAFLSRPTVMSSEQIRHAPYVLAFRDHAPGRRLGQRGLRAQPVREREQTLRGHAHRRTPGRSG